MCVYVSAPSLFLATIYYNAHARKGERNNEISLVCGDKGLGSKYERLIDSRVARPPTHEPFYERIYEIENGACGGIYKYCIIDRDGCVCE